MSESPPKQCIWCSHIGLVMGSQVARKLRPKDTFLATHTMTEGICWGQQVSVFAWVRAGTCGSHLAAKSSITRFFSVFWNGFLTWQFSGLLQSKTRLFWEKCSPKSNTLRGTEKRMLEVLVITRQGCIFHARRGISYPFQTAVHGFKAEFVLLVAAMAV